jgi:hypothetical protein
MISDTNVTKSLTLTDASSVFIATLGPTGTNLELAAQDLKARLLAVRPDLEISVNLYKTLEVAVEECKKLSPTKGRQRLLVSCAPYPGLNDLIFKNIDLMELTYSFIIPTREMVVAAHAGADISKRTIVYAHPAVTSLAEQFGDAVLLSSSNSQAAIDCKADSDSACVCTIEAAREQGLSVVHSFGTVPVDFCVHSFKEV